MRVPTSLTTALVAILTITTVAAQSGRAHTQQETNTATATERQAATSKEIEQNEAAERRRVQERRRREKSESSGETSAITEPSPSASPTAKYKTSEEIEKETEDYQRRADAEQQKFLDKLKREANKPLPTVKLPSFPDYSRGNTYPLNSAVDDNERQRIEAERIRQNTLAQEREQEIQQAFFMQRILPVGGAMLISFVALIGFGLWQFPENKAIRFHARNFGIGVAGLTVCAILISYLSVVGNGVELIRPLTFFALLVFAVITFAGIVGITASFCTLAQNKAMRLMTVLLVSFAGLAASQWIASQDRLNNIGDAGFVLFIFVLLIGLIKVSSGSRGMAGNSASDEDEYHGTARFATKKEIATLTVKRGDVPTSGGFILAPSEPDKGRKGQVVLPRIESVKHGLILGGSGTGKSRGYFLPNCAQSVGTSLVVTDPKSELWTLTSGFQERALRFAPAEPQATEGFNWIPLCSNARMAELCARAIMESGQKGGNTDQFWIDAESAYLAAIFAHASTLAEATPLTAYRLFTRQTPDALLKQLLESSSETAREQAIIFTQTDPRLKGAIVPAVAARLQFLRDTNVQRFTSATASAPDFGRLRHEPTAIYWCLREQDIARLRPLTSLFFTVLLEQLAGEQVPDGVDGVPITMMLDEFANIGVIPEFETTVSLARGRGVAIWLGIQSLSQLDKSYGHSNAQTIISNCATKIALHGLDFQTAKSISDMLGERTIVAKRSSLNFSTGGIGVGRSGTEHRRPLMTPDEVMRLSEQEAIIRTGNKYPMKLNKGYYDYPANTAITHPLGEAKSASFPAASDLLIAASAQATVVPDSI